MLLLASALISYSVTLEPLEERVKGKREAGERKINKKKVKVTKV